MGEATEGQGSYELGCAVTQDGLDVGASLNQFAGQIQRLVAGDAAGNAQDNVLSSESGLHMRHRWRVILRQAQDERAIGLRMSG